MHKCLGESYESVSLGKKWQEGEIMYGKTILNSLLLLNVVLKIQLGGARQLFNWGTCCLEDYYTFP